jgi:hypothetical protein
MVHLHYSPYQFATDVQAAEQKVDGMKMAKKLNKMVAKDKLMPKLMSRDEAKGIPGSPNAFIAPNPIDEMRMIRDVFGGV